MGMGPLGGEAWLRPAASPAEGGAASLAMQAFPAGAPCLACAVSQNIASCVSRNETNINKRHTNKSHWMGWQLACIGSSTTWVVEVMEGREGCCGEVQLRHQ